MIPDFCISNTCLLCTAYLPRTLFSPSIGTSIPRLIQAHETNLTIWLLESLAGPRTHRSKIFSFSLQVMTPHLCSWRPLCCLQSRPLIKSVWSFYQQRYYHRNRLRQVQAYQRSLALFCSGQEYLQFWLKTYQYGLFSFVMRLFN